MIDVTDLCVDLGGERVLDRVTLSVPRGSLLALLGPSGAGKTVLLKALCGLVPIASGSVRIDGEEVAGRDEEDLFALRARIGMLFQHGALFDALSVFENVAFPLRRRRAPEAEIRRKVDEELENVRLAHAADLLPAELSGGMRKRVGIARALVTDPPVSLFDEPTAGLDPVTAAKILGLLAEARTQRQVAGIAVGHELRTLLEVCDRAAMLLHGRLVFSGTVDELRRAESPAVRQFVTGALEGPL